MLLAAWRAGLFVLVLAAIVLAVLGLFYYLRILSAAYMKEGDDRAKPKPGLPLGFAIGLCLAAVIGLGLWPSPLVDSAGRAASALVGSSAHASR